MAHRIIVIALLLPVCAAATLSPWRSAVDPATGRTYYWNRESRERTWYRPPDFDEEAVMAAVPAVEPAASPRITWSGPSKGPVALFASRARKAASGIPAFVSGLVPRLPKDGGNVERTSTAENMFYLGSVLALGASVL